MDGFYRKNRWVPLPLPDSRFAPGVVFSYAKNTGIRYVSNLKTCGVPEEVSPRSWGGREADLRRQERLRRQGGPRGEGSLDGARVLEGQGTSVALESHGPASMDLLKVQIWLSSPQNAEAFPEACKQALAQSDIFIVQEAYQVRKGKFTLHDATTASIAVKGAEAGPVKIEPNAGVKVNQDGTLEFDQPLYTAVRRVRRINGGFQTLGRSPVRPTPTTRS